MSVSRYLWNEKCEGDLCIGDCDQCHKAEEILEVIEKLEPFNNTDCPEWVKNVIRGKR